MLFDNVKTFVRVRLVKYRTQLNFSNKSYALDNLPRILLVYFVIKAVRKPKNKPIAIPPKLTHKNDAIPNENSLMVIFSIFVKATTIL